MSVREMLKNASLISVQVGQADIVYKAQIFGFNELNLSDIKSLPSGIGKINSLLFNYFDYWKKAYPLLLDFIKENNPDATVVLIGTMNPIENATIAEKVLKAIDNNLAKESLKTNFSFDTLFLLIFDNIRTTFSRFIPAFK